MDYFSRAGISKNLLVLTLMFRIGSFRLILLKTSRLQSGLLMFDCHRPDIGEEMRYDDLTTF